MSASNCKKNIDILDQADVFGIISNLLLPDFKVISQSSGILPLSKIINKNICLNFTTYRIEDITTQQLKIHILTSAENNQDTLLHLEPEVSGSFISLTISNTKEGISLKSSRDKQHSVFDSFLAKTISISDIKA
ncbi:19446_t:CDS:2, partial [Funneliformis geosporum]